MCTESEDKPSDEESTHKEDAFEAYFERDLYELFGIHPKDKGDMS